MVTQRDWATPPRFEPLPYRLLDSVDGPHPFTGHQKLGLQYRVEACAPVSEVSYTGCSDEPGATKTPTVDGATWRGSDPFPVYTWVDCGLVSVGETELKRMTLTAHERNVMTTVENVFWTGGDNGTMPHLAENTPVTEVSGGSVVTVQTAATVITGTYDVVEAVGILEREMGECYGGSPMIHVPRSALAHMAANHLIREKGPRITTGCGGSIVVAGLGYDGSGPDGTQPAAGLAWFYATGSVKMWRSEVIWMARDAREYLGREVNDTVLIAEQWFALGWDCCHLAILVDLGGVITGDPQSAT